MARKLKRPDGMLVEEYITGSAHFFDGGKLTHHNQDPDGEYTGRIAFKFKDGSWTKWYTKATAPKWLLALWEESQ